MNAKRGYRQQKPDAPRVGRWLKRYFTRRTCRRWQLGDV